MELNQGDKFKETLFKTCPSMEEYEEECPSLLQLLMGESGVKDIDTELKDTYEIGNNQRKDLFGQLLSLKFLIKIEKEILLGWLFNSIMDKLAKTGISQQLESVEFSPQKFQEELNMSKTPKEFVLNMIKTLLADNKLNLSSKQIEKLTTLIKSEPPYQYLQKVIPQGQQINEEESLAEKKMVQEVLSNIESDLTKYYPGSLEQVVQKLLLMSYKSHFIKSKEDFGETIQKIWKIYVEEKELWRRHPDKQEIDKTIQQLRPGNMSSQDFYSKVQELKRKILIIDSLELTRLLNESNKAKTKIKNQNVILVMGMTGSGKSTNILKFLGNNFKMINVKGAKIWVPDEKLKIEHQSFHTSHKCVSCTTVINSTQIPSEMKKKMKKADQNEKFFIVDTPGFIDTRGAEYDISNQMGAINALYGCNSVRLIIILPDSACKAERAKGARQMATTISSLAPDYDEIRSSMKIYINNIDNISRDIIKLNISSLLKDKQKNQISTKQAYFLEDLLEAANQDETFICPVMEESKIYMQRLKSVIKLDQINSGSIQTAFRKSYSQESKTKINNYWSFYVEKVKALILSHDYQRADYYFDSVKHFGDLFVQEYNQASSSSDLQNSRLSDHNLLHVTGSCSEKIEDLSNFIIAQVDKLLRKLEENLQIIIKNDSTQKQYQESDRIMKEIEKIIKRFARKIINMPSSQKIQTLIVDYGEILKKEFQPIQKQTIETLTKRIITYSEFFKLPNLNKSIIQQNEEKFEKNLRQIQRDVVNQSYSIEREHIQEIQLLSTLLSMLKKDHSSVAKFRNLKDQVDSKYKHHINKIDIHLKGKMSQSVIDQLKSCLQKCEKLFKMNLLEDSALKQKQKNATVTKITRICQQKIRKLFSSSQIGGQNDELFEANVIQQIQNIKTEILVLLKLDFVAANCDKFYHDTIGDMKLKFENSINSLKIQVQQREHCQGVQIEQYEAYFESIKRKLENIIKFSRIISTETTSGSQIKDFVTSLQDLFQQLRDKIVKLPLTQSNIMKSLQKWKEILRKMKCQKKILLRHKMLDPLRQKFEQIKIQFDKKISQPLIDFKSSIQAKLQNRRFISFKGCLDSIQNLFCFIEVIEKQVSWLGCNQFYEKQNNFQKFIKEKLIGQLNTKLSTFIDSINLEISDQLISYVQVLSSIKGKQGLMLYLVNYNFNPQQHIEDLQNKLQYIEKKMKEKLQQETESLQTMLEQVKILRAIEEVISKKEKESFKNLCINIRQQQTKRSSDTEDKIKIIIGNENDMQVLFEQLRPIIKTLKEDDRRESKQKLKVLSILLEKCIQKILKEIRKYDKEHRNLILSDEQNTELKDQLFSYILTNKAAIKFSQQIKQIDLESILKEKCILRINKTVLGGLFVNLDDIFESQKMLLITYIQKFDLKNLPRRATLIAELENCLQLNQDPDYKFKEKRFEFNQALCNEVQTKFSKNQDSLDKLAAIKSQSKKDTVCQVVRQINSLLIGIAKRKYQNNELVMDQNLSDFYDSQLVEGKENHFKNRIITYMSSRLENYNSSEGSYDDEEAKKIKQQISFLPLILKKQFDKEFAQNKKIYDNNRLQEEKKFLGNIRANQTGICQLLEKIVSIFDKYDKKYRFYCQKLKEFLKQRYQKAQSAEDFTKIIEQYYQIPAKEAISLKGHIEIQEFYSSYYKFILKSMKNLVKENLEDLNSKIIDTKVEEKTPQFDQNVDVIFKVYTTISSKKNNLICKEPVVEDDLLSQWKRDILILITTLKNKIQELDPVQTLGQTEYTLKNYFIQLQRSTQLLKSIKLQYNQLPRHLKEGQIVEIGANIQSIPSYDQKIEQFRKYLSHKFDCLKQFELISSDRHNQKDESISLEFSRMNSQIESFDKKLEIMTNFVFNGSTNDNVPQKFKKFKTTFDSKFDTLVKNVQKELQQCFEEPQKEASKLVNCFLNISKLLKKNQLCLVQPEKIQQAVAITNESIKNKFKQLLKKTKEKSKQVEKEMYEINMNIKKKTQEVDYKKNTLNSKLNAEIKGLESNSKKFLAEKLAKLSTQEQKDSATKMQNGDLNSQINMKTFDANKVFTNLQEELGYYISKENERAEKICVELCGFLILNQKNITQINQPDSINKNNFVTFMNELDDNDDFFIHNLTRSLTKINDSYSYGNQIIKKYKVFDSYNDLQRQQLTKTQDIQYVLRESRALNDYLEARQFGEHQKNIIRTKFYNFNEEFTRNLRDYQNQPDRKTINNLKESIIEKAEQLRKNVYQSKKPRMGKKQIFLAKIFALFAILKSQRQSSSEKKNRKATEITFKPHEIQVVTILLLLGIVRDKNQSLASRMAEVGTGEGKSIVLAIMSTYLALVGFNVRCACYSQYLSQRDEEGFKDLFGFLDISQKIKYGTFNNICEQILNVGGNFKQQVYSMILKQQKGFLNNLWSIFGNRVQIKREKNETQLKTILLIDEADVFFEDSFYGQSYRPSIKIKDELISNLLMFIWKKTKANTKQDPKIVKEIKKSSQFQKVIQKYKKLEDILQKQLHGIVQGAYSYKHDYTILDQERRLVYKQNDSINFKLSYGYKTVFANIFQFEKARVSRMNLDEALCIELIIAEFSYAVLPTKFKHIIGVTGTLQAMPMCKKKILKEKFSVLDNYLIPSSYGINQRRNYNYCQVQQKVHFSTIVEKIEKVDKKRPIIVFFQSASRLYDFFNSPEYVSLKGRTLILTEEHQPSVRQRNVSLATHPNTISLMTKSFGRGTDFQVFDKAVQEAGGVHIIQTFLSQDEAEEIQIKGRTNRQCSNGSVDIIYKKIELEPLAVKQDLKNANLVVIGSILSQAREAKAAQSYEERYEMIKISGSKHERVNEIYGKQNLKQQELLQYIQSINVVKKVGKQVIRTALAIDATGSMGGVLNKVLTILKETFKRTYAVLQEQKVQVNVQICLMVYRNYNSPSSQLIETTPFQSNLDNLLSFLGRVKAKGGAGTNTEAIETCLQVINSYEDVSQVIMIGDARQNKQHTIKSLRNDKGEAFWNKNGFPKTDAASELKKWTNQCPIHTFYIGYARQAFQWISIQTKGEANQFPINDPKAAVIMSQFIVKHILAIGEQKLVAGGMKNPGLLACYEKMFS